MFKCACCKSIKEKDEFYSSKRNRSGVQSFCKECNKLWVRKRYIANKKYYDDKNRETRRNNQVYVLNFLRSHPCVACGENDPIVLDFDHIEKKLLSVSKMVTKLWSIKKIQEEIDKCQILCSNCHRRKTAKDFNYFRNIGSTPF